MTERMPRPKSDLDSQVTVVLPGAWLDEADELAQVQSNAGLRVTRSDVLRLAIREGLDLAKTRVKKARK